MTSPLTDEELFEKWRDGCEASGRTLFDRHFAPIYRFFRNKVADAAEDLTQQTFLGCVRAKDRFRGEAKFRTYLFSIARNRLYSYLREQDQKRSHEAGGYSSIANLFQATPTEVISNNREHKLLLRALRHLPLEMQIALELHYWEGMGVQDISEIVETPVGTIKRRLQRARIKLESTIRELAESSELAQSTCGGLQHWAEELRRELKKK